MVDDGQTGEFPLLERYTELIEDACGQVYPGRPVTRQLSPQDGSPFAGGIVITRGEDHWSLVTAGLGLPTRTPREAGYSGRGIELSIKVDLDALDPRSDDPPWAFGLLARLADYVEETDTVLLPGARIRSPGPLGGDPAEPAHNLLFTSDRVLRTIDGPPGRIDLVQVVPATDEELARAETFSTAAVVDTLAEDNPLLIARLYR
jgi:hypothetical protein